jgi:hypothetical protein
MSLFFYPFDAITPNTDQNGISRLYMREDILNDSDGIGPSHAKSANYPLPRYSFAARCIVILKSNT